MFVMNGLGARVAQERDVAQIVTWINDPDLEDLSQGRPPEPRSEVEILERVRSGHPAVFNGDPDSTEWALFRADDASQRIIGYLGLYAINDHDGRAEVGVVIGDEAARGLGLGIDAYALAGMLGFRRRRLHKLTGHVKASNAAALGTLERIGFAPSGTLKEHRWIDGQFVDLVIFEFLARDWRDSLADWRRFGVGEVLRGGVSAE